MLYKNCRELPIHNFNECEAFNDYQYLIKDKKEHADEDLYSKWGEIYAEYLELLKSDEIRSFYKDKMALYLLSAKVKQIESIKTIIGLMPYLGEEESKAMKEQVSKIAKKMRIDNVDQAFEIFSSRLQTKIDDFNRMYDSKKETSTVDDMIPVLIKQGYPINRHTTTVSEYCNILNAIQKN